MKQEVEIMSEWFSILKDLNFYATRRIEDLKHELNVTDDVKLKEVIKNQIKYWESVLAKE